MNTAMTQFAAPALPSPRGGGRRSRQRGISLFIVMIILLLALILVIGGLSVASLNESLVGNQSDAQRAYGAAQALMDAAQRDIRLNGRGCNAALMGGGGTNNDFPVTGGGGAACTLRFPRDKDEYMGLVHSGQIVINATSGGCAAPDSKLIGVCIPMGPTDAQFSTGSVGSNALIWNGGSNDNGAAYDNSFITALDAGSAITAYGGQARLGANTAAPGHGRYWVEVFPYNTTSVGLPQGMARAPVPSHDYPFVFRITAMARGLRGDTVSVLRTYYTPYPMPAAPAAVNY